MHYLPDDKLRHFMFLVIDLIDLQGLFSIMALISPRNWEFFSYQNDQSEASEQL